MAACVSLAPEMTAIGLSGSSLIAPIIGREDEPLLQLRSWAVRRMNTSNSSARSLRVLKRAGQGPTNYWTGSGSCSVENSHLPCHRKTGLDICDYSFWPPASYCWFLHSAL
jgi:hypothetical protein